MRLLSVLVGLAALVGTAFGLSGVHITETHQIIYNVNIPANLNFVHVEDVMISDNIVYAPIDDTHQIGDIITYPNIIAKVVDFKDNFTVANILGIHDVIQNGTISIHPKGLQSTAEKDIPFCYSFNSKNCKTPDSSISLFENKYLDLTCDNCFVGFSGNVFAEIVIDWFRIKNVAGGFRNLDLIGGLGVNLQATSAPSYAFDKLYPVINKFTIASFNIGPIPVNLWLELPVELILNAGLDASANARIGTNINFNIGNTYFTWDRSSGFKFYGPSNNVMVKPYLTHKESLNGQAGFKILASLKLHLDNIFEVQADLTPEIDAALSGNCLDGAYHVSLDYQGVVMKDTFGPKNIYDSGVRQLVHICA